MPAYKGWPGQLVGNGRFHTSSLIDQTPMHLEMPQRISAAHPRLVISPSL